MVPIGNLQKGSNVDLIGGAGVVGYFSFSLSTILWYANGENIEDTSDSKLPNLSTNSESSENNNVSLLASSQTHKDFMSQKYEWVSEANE